MVRVELAEQGAEKRGFPRTHLPGKGDEPRAVVYAVQEMSKGLAVVLAQENEAGVGRQAEGLFPETIEVEVH
jgi:hypothetical protein